MVALGSTTTVNLPQFLPIDANSLDTRGRYVV